MKLMFYLSPSKYRIRNKKSKPSKSSAREVNQVKAVLDKDKGNILNFSASLALASPYCKINWPIGSNVVLSSSPLNLENSGTL
jgi:hypothetical protein